MNFLKPKLKQKKFNFLLFLTILILPFNLNAEGFPEIYGCFCEGGLITGNLSNADNIKIDDKRIEIFEDGRFIFAFGRKYKDVIKIKVNKAIKKFSVSDKKYKIENIKGLPKNKVEPSKNELKKILSDQKRIKEAKKIGLKKKLFNKKFILPSKGRLSGVYGSQRILNSKPRRPHAGIDIAAKEGTKIVAPSSGIIKLVERNMFFTGNTVIIDHGLGLISIFAHLKDVFVNEGKKVIQGDKIGSIGMTGRATGPHLHWGVYLNNISVDPMTLLNYELN